LRAEHRAHKGHPEERSPAKAQTNKPSGPAWLAQTDAASAAKVLAIADDVIEQRLVATSGLIATMSLVGHTG
jgi:hypothetical protein